MKTQLYTYNKVVDTYFYFGFGGITIILGLLFLLAPLLFPLAFILFGALLIITGIACFIEGSIMRFRN